MLVKVKSDEARKRWRFMMDTVSRGDAVVIERYNTPTAALIGYDDFLALQEELEDLRDLRQAKAAYAEWEQDPSTAIPWEEAKAQLIGDGVIDE
jgi:prevent-host-death family protein